MRNILIHADHAPSMAARTESALAIGRRFRSHLSFLISSPYQMFVTSDPFGGMYLAREEMAKAQLADAELEKRLGVELEREDVPWDVAIADGDALSVMTLAATLADLAIVSLGQRDRYGSAAPTIAADLALTVSAPVLALSAGSAAIDLDAPIVVAWNGSQQAANALRAGVPLMDPSSRVLLLTAGDDAGRVPAEDALRYMSRHGVHAEWRRESARPDTPEEVLVHIATEIGAGLIVMGAYGRPRLRETLFGGVTRYMLETSSVPLLLAH